MSNTPERGVIALLTAQALAFGVMLALVVVPANAIFLDAYGAKWLPATYIAIAVFGTAASALIARAARRTRLVRVATASLFGIAVLYAASWLILVAGGVWVSAGLLVLFPIALQLGFVFIGGQAGRLLDVRQMKERFPRVVGGFSVGFLLGGLLAFPLLALLGSTENLLLGTTVAQLAFLGLLLETERRFPEVRSAPTETSQDAARPSARTLFASGLVLLLLVYQVLSAMGSWLVDYLLFNRASAHYSGDDLTRFLSGYTAVLNLVDILFLALLAGPLLRRFGLRLGLVLNPAVVAALLAVMAVVVAGPGAAAYGLFVLAAVTRLTDIVLSDGTTRTSVNASFQVVPIQDRLAVQAVVEGIGVPVAIGATGAVLLLMNLLGLGIGAVIVFGAVLSVIWTVSGAAMYRSYTRALADEMRRRSLVASAYDVAEDDGALQALLRSDDARDVRLGLDLLPGIASPASTGALRQASEHADPEVRLRALVQLAADGDAQAAAEVQALATDLARSADPAERRAAASALGPRRIVTAGHEHAHRPPRRRGSDRPRGGARLRDPRGCWRAGRRPSGRCSARGAAYSGQRDRRGQAARRLGRPSPRSRARPRRSVEAPASGACGCQCGDGARVGGHRARAPRPRSRGGARGARRAGCGRRRRRRTVRLPRRRVRRRGRARSSHSRCARGARRFRSSLCGERWRTSATSHGDSSSPCSRFATAIASGTPFESWTAQRASVVRSESRRSTC